MDHNDNAYNNNGRVGSGRSGPGSRSVSKDHQTALIRYRIPVQELRAQDLPNRLRGEPQVAPSIIAH